MVDAVEPHRRAVAEGEAVADEQDALGALEAPAWLVAVLCALAPVSTSVTNASSVQTSRLMGTPYRRSGFRATAVGGQVVNCESDAYAAPNAGW